MIRLNIAASVIVVAAAGVAAGSAMAWAATPTTTQKTPMQAAAVETGLTTSAPAKIDHSSIDGDRQAPSLQLELTGAGLSVSSPWKSYTVTSGGSLSALFARAGLPATAWLSLLELKGKVDTLRHLHPDDSVRIKKTSSGQLAALEYQLSPLKTLHVERSGDRFNVSITRKQTTIHQVRIAGHIKNSLLGALESEGVDPTVAANFAHIFHWRIDLSRAIRAGDRFVLIYQRDYAGHQPLQSGPILAAELDTGNRTLSAFRYVDKQGHSHYYDLKGNSLQPSILRTPVNYTRVSSHFSLNRLNPVLHIWRPHYGVDLAAPKGTPIKAAANGHVKFVGRDGGYGRLVILKNFGPYSTRYGHMSRFADDLHKGDYVHQGQVIGYVGESGVATGPHLHFEIRINGKPKPPLKVKLPDGAPISSTQLATFRQSIGPFLAEMQSAPASGRTLLAEWQEPTQGSGGDQLQVASLHPATPVVSQDAEE